MADTDDDKKKKEQEKEEKKKKEKEQEEKNKALRLQYEREMENFEKTSNETLDRVREKGVSVNNTDDKKKLPEQISDIHILFSRQKEEFVFEGVDTSEELEKEINGEGEEDEDEDS